MQGPNCIRNRFLQLVIACFKSGPPARCMVLVWTLFIFLSDARVKDEDGSTPLHSACRKKCKNVIDDSEDDTSDPEKQVSGTYA